MAKYCGYCNDSRLMYYPIENASVNDGDGTPTYWTEDFWHCNDCDRYFDDGLNQVSKPIQYPLI